MGNNSINSLLRSMMKYARRRTPSAEDCIYSNTASLYAHASNEICAMHLEPKTMKFDLYIRCTDGHHHRSRNMFVYDEM